MKYKDLHSALEAFRKSGDAGSFRCIYELLSGRLYYLCLRYLKNEADAQDVLQESFVTAFKKIDSFSGEGSFEGWVRRITVNNCLSKLRLDKRKLETEIHAWAETDDEEEYLVREETEAKLLEAMKSLPDGYRTIINLAIIEDYSHREIGEMLGISEGTSRSQLSRAKTALKIKLEQS